MDKVVVMIMIMNAEVYCRTEEKVTQRTSIPSSPVGVYIRAVIIWKGLSLGNLILPHNIYQSGFP